MKRKTIGICVCMLLIATTFACLVPTASALPDLVVPDLWRGYIGTPRYWQVGYKLYNAGTTDIENEDFSDAGYYYWFPNWYKISASEKRHYNFDLESQHYSGNYFYNWYAPSGWKFFTQCTDIYDEVQEVNEDNNCNTKFWNWNDL